jgi:hypothetical protein
VNSICVPCSWPNEIRSARARLKKDLALRTARVRDVLLALPKIGSVKAGRILADCGIAHSKTLAGLTERQRTELLKRFHAACGVPKLGSACKSGLFAYSTESWRLWGAEMQFSCCEAVFVDQSAESISTMDVV